MGRLNERTNFIKRFLSVWQIEFAGVDALTAHAEPEKEAGIRGAALLLLTTTLSSAARSLVLNSSIDISLMIQIVSLASRLETIL